MTAAVAHFFADAVVLLHLGFAVFVVAGGLLVLSWPKVAWGHLPCLAWGAAIELSGWVCPLTPLENHLRLLAGLETYADGFIAHYVLPVLYPASLDRPTQRGLAAALILLNVVVYGLVWHRHRQRRRLADVSPGEQSNGSGT